MLIEPQDRGTYQVVSHGNKHFVDLLAFRGNGACSCPHFLARLKPAILEAESLNAFVPHSAYRCPHINECREDLLNMFLAQLQKQFPDTEDI